MSATIVTPRETTIEKYKNFVDVVKSKTLNTGAVSAVRLARKHRVNSSIVTYLRELGFLLSVGKKKKNQYQWVSKPGIGTAEIAKRIAEYHYEKHPKQQGKTARRKPKKAPGTKQAVIDLAAKFAELGRYETALKMLKQI